MHSGSDSHVPGYAEYHQSRQPDNLCLLDTRDDLLARQYICLVKQKDGSKWEFLVCYNATVGVAEPQGITWGFSYPVFEV